MEKQVQTAPEGPSARPPSGFRTVLLGFVQLVLMAAILFGGYATMDWLTQLKQDPPSRPPFKTIYTVDSVIAQHGAHQPAFTVYGEVQPSRSVELRSLVAGAIISVNPDLKVGGRIEKGAELFRIDPFTYEKDLALAISNLAETDARIVENEARLDIEQSRITSLQEQLDLAQKDLERFTSLRQRGAATAKNVEDRALIVSQRRQALEQSQLNLVVENNRLKQLEATRDRFRWSRDQAERNLRDTVLRSPIAAIVSQKNVAEGRLINANDMAVALYEADRLEVRFTLTDQRFGRIQSDKDGLAGRPVEVIWNVGAEEFRYPARIDRIGAQITSNRGGVEVIAVLDDVAGSAELRPGAFVQIIVPDRLFEKHFRLPETALYDGDTVYIIRNSEIVSSPVEVHAYDQNHVIVSGALSDGDEVMTTRIAEISEGLKVRKPDEIIANPDGSIDGRQAQGSVQE